MRKRKKKKNEERDDGLLHLAPLRKYDTLYSCLMGLTQMLPVFTTCSKPPLLTTNQETD
jgi:hypothetical protein